MIEPKNMPPDNTVFAIRTSKGVFVAYDCAEVVFGQHWIRLLDEAGRLQLALPAHEILEVYAVDKELAEADILDNDSEAGNLPGSATVTGPNDGMPTDS
jgi:hypothetical protein